MTIDRHPQWEQRLHDLLAKHFSRPYEAGRWDCLMFPAAVVHAVTSKDFAKGHRGKYNSTAKAYRYLKNVMGFNSPADLLDSLFDQKPIGFAGQGDIVLCRTPTGDNPGVVIGHHALVVGEDNSGEGLVRVDRKDWLKAWSVGDHHSGPVELKKHKRK